MEANKKVRMAVIVGAGKALTYKRQNPHATETEILQQIADEMDEITGKIDESN